jgi:parallel beta-helix repeat protein
MLKFNENLYLCLPLLLASTASAANWCVNPAGSGGCAKTIAAAVASAAAGDTVSVAAGTYKENVVVGKSISLIGGDSATTIIEAKGLPTGIYINGIDNQDLAGILISGFTVQNANYEGILAVNVSAVNISGNIVQGNNKKLDFSTGQPSCPGIPNFETGEDFDCGEGIHLSGTHHSSVIGNTVTGNAGGILISDDTAAAHDNLISGNTVSDNVLDCGITIASHVPAAFTKASTAFGVFSNVVAGNTASRNGTAGEGAGVGIFASAPGTGAYGNMVTGNTLTGNGIPGVAIHGHTPNQNLNGNQIIGNTISANGADQADTPTSGPAGINIGAVSPINGTVISQNTFSQEGIDVVINAPGTFSVTRNTFARGGIGVMSTGRGQVSAEGNYWGCGSDPRSPFPGFTSCAAIAGNVTVNTWQSNPFSK